jgi:hypothetical protein
MPRSGPPIAQDMPGLSREGRTSPFTGIRIGVCHVCGLITRSCPPRHGGYQACGGDQGGRQQATGDGGQVGSGPRTCQRSLGCPDRRRALIRRRGSGTGWSVSSRNGRVSRQTWPNRSSGTSSTTSRSPHRRVARPRAFGSRKGPLVRCPSTRDDQNPEGLHGLSIGRTTPRSRLANR